MSYCPPVLGAMGGRGNVFHSLSEMLNLNIDIAPGEHLIIPGILADCQHLWDQENIFDGGTCCYVNK